MHSEPVALLCVVGTRPEAIKMAPVIAALKREAWTAVRVLATAQHRDMLDKMLAVFGIAPDIDLDIMEANQSLPVLTARLLTALDDALARERPAFVLGQGDTTTVLATALACFYRRIPFGHIEAGLRTQDLENPFPEEMNRVVASRLTRLHFAPTESARSNLLAEGIAADSIHVTGNPVIDALLDTAACTDGGEIGLDLDPTKRLVLVTAHRRESFGQPLVELCRALRLLVDRHDDIQILYPVHPNPNVMDVVRSELGGNPRILLCAPLDYRAFVSALKRSFLVLSDSGGVQEEAPALGKPVLVLRDETERPEAVNAGVVKVIGMRTDRIVQETTTLLRVPAAYQAMARGVSPYGDGKAAARIVGVLRKAFDTLDTPLESTRH